MHPRDIGDASSPTSRGSSPLAGVLSKLEMEKTSFRDVLQLSGWLGRCTHVRVMDVSEEVCSAKTSAGRNLHDSWCKFQPFLRLARELCSAFLLCAKLISHVATSMRLAALRPRQPYSPVGTAAGWSAVPERASRSRTAVAAEVLFLRKQLAYYQDHQIRPRRLTDGAGLSLVLWSRFFDWKEALMVVTPGTFVRRHRRGFKLYWRWKARGGQPALPKDIRPAHRSHSEGEHNLGRRARR